MPRKTFQEKCDLIIKVKELYDNQKQQSNINIRKIANQLNIPESTIRDIFYSNFAEPKISRKYTNEQVKEMRRMFTEENLTCPEISKIYNCDMSTVRNLLNILGVYENKFKFVKNNPFLNDCSERDYWLGYIIADGYISSSNFCIKLSQNNEDKYHLINYSKFVNVDFKEHSSADQYYVEFSDKNTHEWFCNMGIVPKKSTIVNPTLPLNRDILRGIFDGDGSVNYNYTKITGGSPWLLGRIMGYLDALNIKYTLGKDKHDIKKENHNSCFDLFISQENNNLEKFYNLLYFNVPEHLYLKRKKLKFNVTENKNSIAEIKHRESEKALQRVTLIQPS